MKHGQLENKPQKQMLRCVDQAVNEDVRSRKSQVGGCVEECTSWGAGQALGGPPGLPGRRTSPRCAALARGSDQSGGACCWDSRGGRGVDRKLSFQHESLGGGLTRIQSPLPFFLLCKRAFNQTVQERGVLSLGDTDVFCTFAITAAWKWENLEVSGPRLAAPNDHWPLAPRAERCSAAREHGEATAREGQGAAW